MRLRHKYVIYLGMLEYFARLFTYDEWANGEVLAKLSANGGQSPRSLKLFGHILAAQRLWLERLQQRPQTLPVWPDLTVQQCEAQAEELPRLWKDYLRRLTASDLDRTVAYANSKGEHYSSRVEDILTHVVMHSAYHRGQIAADMRAAGITPAYTDFIQGVRQGTVR